MKRIASAVSMIACLGLLGGCGKKKAQEGLEPLQAPEGSAAGSAIGSAAATKAATSDEVAKRFDECWGFWNASKYAEFQGCYTADATRDVPGSGIPVATGAAA